MTDPDQLAAGFETHRPYLHAIAYRTLGSHADADDAVQEAWLRLARTGGGIDDLRGWLTTVTGRICLDLLRRRGTRGEQPLELSLGPLPDGKAGPAEEALLGDSVSLALYVVMDSLTPAERVSFVLHDLFEVPFDAIAGVLGRSTAATKMLATRARRRIRLGGPESGAGGAAARAVVDAFFAATGRGDLAGLLAVLAPDVELRLSRGPGETVVVRGARTVAGQARLGARPDAVAHPVLAGGRPAVVITVGGRPFTLMAFTVDGGVITVIRVLADPAWLAQAVPSWLADPPAPAGR